MSTQFPGEFAKHQASGFPLATLGLRDINRGAIGRGKSFAG
jgi:hypothetical protein